MCIQIIYKPAGDTTVKSIVTEFPPNDSCSKRVTRESLYGTFPPDFRAVKTLINVLTLQILFHRH